jgi:hypothetical protein
MSEIQAVMFSKNKNEFGFKWTIQKAKKWLSEHNIFSIKSARETPNYYRFRINNPNKYNSFITKKTNVGIYFIIGFS